MDACETNCGYRSLQLYESSVRFLPVAQVAGNRGAPSRQHAHITALMPPH